MKIISLLIMITISFQSKASWLKTALVLDAVSTPYYEIKKDKQSEMLDIIKNKLPNKGFYASYEFISFDIPKEDQSYYLSYFKNDGYKNVSIKNNKLFFDFKGHSKIRKELDLKYKKGNNIIFISFTLFLTFLFTTSIYISSINIESREIILNMNRIGSKKYNYYTLSFFEKRKIVKKHNDLLNKSKENKID